MDQNEIEMSEPGDSRADAITAVVLVLVFVVTCIFWINSQ